MSQKKSKDFQRMAAAKAAIDNEDWQAAKMHLKQVTGKEYRSKATSALRKVENRLNNEYTASVSMSDVDMDLTEAKRLIRQQKYEDARAILITIDDPKADALLAKLPVATISKKSVEDKSFTNKLVIAFVLLWFAFVPGWIATMIWAGEAKRSPDAPGAKAMILLNRVTFGMFLLFAVCGAATLAIVYVGNAASPYR